MTPRFPRSPLTTQLSGSARETEYRIRSIFQWKKKRPPMLVLALAAVLIALCGGLVSCQQRTQSVTLAMDTQYYDTQGNYIEIPTLVMSAGAQPTKGVIAINQALVELKHYYQPVLDGVVGYSSVASMENHCLLYPSETKRYWNLLFFREEFYTDLNTGHITSLVYDKEEGQQVTLEDALELAGQTTDGLCQALADQYDPTLGQDIPGADLCIQDQVVEGFRMGADGQPIFYLTARVDDRDDAVSDFVSGSDNLYIWSGGTFTLYDQYTITDLQPLVPAQECTDLDPPLWRQWNFSGGEPEEGFSSAVDLSTLRTNTERRDTLIRAHMESHHTSVPTWYYLEDYPEDAAPGAALIESVTPLASGETDGQHWLIFELGCSRYIADGAPLYFGWHGYPPMYITLGQDDNGMFTKVLGCGEDFAYQLAPQVMSVLADSSVYLIRDGFSFPIGPGKPLTSSCLDTIPVDTQRLEDYEPIYYPGDYWQRSNGTADTGSFTALSYYNSAENREYINTLDVTMTDLYTSRGIHVGASRTEVMEAYPEAVTGNYWGKYPDEPDMLSYIPSSDHDPSQVTDFSDLESPCFGPAILFFFSGDTLRQITLTDMFD